MPIPIAHVQDAMPFVVLSLVMTVIAALAWYRRLQER